jgi:hypothetical protein
MTLTDCGLQSVESTPNPDLFGVTYTATSEFSDVLIRGGLSLALLECDYVDTMEKAREGVQGFQDCLLGMGRSAVRLMPGQRICKIRA